MRVQCSLNHPNVSGRPIQLILPMSGQGTRYQAAGYAQPKPLIPVNGEPMIKRLLDVFPQHWQSYAVLAENHIHTELPAFLRAIRPEINIQSVAAHKRGPGYAILGLLESLPEDAPAIVSYCDYGMKWDPVDFERFVRRSGCDACVVSYRGFHAHYINPLTYAYSRLQGECVRQVKEKGSFTENRETEYASNGAYYFRSVKLLKEALKYQMVHKIEHGGELYLSLTIEALLQLQPQSHVRVYEIPAFYQWGTPADLQTFEYWEKSFEKWNAFQNDLLHHGYSVSHLLIPMAGKGSRFRALTPVSKPFIPIDGVPMFARAAASLPRAEVGSHFVVLREHERDFRSLNMLLNQTLGIDSTADAKFLADTPDGQALSAEAGLELITGTGDVVVSACDHAVVINPGRFADFRSKPECDAAIFTVRGLPAGSRTPNSFAWVKANGSEESEAFPLVEAVSVKKPFENPVQDHLLVGTFWFKNTEILSKGIALLKKSNVRVNGELYLDSIFELLMNHGHKVRIIELDGYIGWGDPDVLAEAMYWHEIFFGHSLSPRSRFPGVRQNVEV